MLDFFKRLLGNEEVIIADEEELEEEVSIEEQKQVWGGPSPHSSHLVPPVSYGHMFESPLYPSDFMNFPKSYDPGFFRDPVLDHIANIKRF
ncbi:MAG: hypothetical protein ABEI13_01580 [Candidatus Paceibacteria bacterium]